MQLIYRWSKSKLMCTICFSVLEEGGKMVGSSAWMLVVGATMLLSKPVYVYTGAAFCQAANIANVFGISFGFAYGGVAIALVRTLLIRNPLNMALKLGAKKGKMRITHLICLVSLLMSAGTVYIWTNVPGMLDFPWSKSVLYFPCRGGHILTF